jgi:uncharacterized protein
MVLSLLALASLIPASIAVSAYRSERRGFIARRRPPRLTSAEFGVPRLRDVAFFARDDTKLVGVYAPSQNGAAVVLLHGGGGERSDVAPEVAILAGAGFGVLAYDSPGHGESGGKISWGEPERRALAAALDFLSEQPGVQPARLAGFGFSMGGYVLAQHASYDERLRAIALAGTPHDPIEHTRWEYRQQGFLRQPAALLAIRVSGMRTDELVPEQVIGRLAPRAVLLVHGSQDQHVPRWMAERLYRAAGEPKRMHVVEGAGHGGYARADAQGYAKALTAFFAALIDARGP